MVRAKARNIPLLQIISIYTNFKDLYPNPNIKVTTCQSVCLY